MSDEVFIDHNELRGTQTKLESIASTDCWGSARSVGEAALGQQRQWGTEQAAVLYRNKLASQLRHTESEIDDLRKNITSLADRIEDALIHAEATDNEIAGLLTEQVNNLNDLEQHTPQSSPPSQTGSFMTWN